MQRFTFYVVNVDKYLNRHLLLCIPFKLVFDEYVACLCLTSQPLTTSSESCGSGSSRGTGGGGPSCCRRKFDEDDFEKEEAQLHQLREANDAMDAQTARMQRERERRSMAHPDAPTAERPQKSRVVSSQPRPEGPMDAGRRSGVGDRRSGVGEQRPGVGERKSDVGAQQPAEGDAGRPGAAP